MRVSAPISTVLQLVAGSYRHLKLALFLTTAGVICALSSISQVPRISESNTLAWFQLNTTFTTSKHWGVHVDANWRRVDFVSNNMQYLFRAGINYKPADRILLRVGFAYALNTPYGDNPINVYGKSFHERRLFQMISVSDKIGSVELNHRLMLEQRWIDRYSKPELSKPDDLVYVNRIRYLLRLQKPFRKKPEQQAYPYIAAYDELFIGFGNEVNVNIFDQNRLACLIGYRINNLVRIEGGYLSQIFQLGRRVNNNSVIQYNKGLQVNFLLNLATTKETK